MAADPIAQFEIKNLVTFGEIGGVEIAFTNSAAFMLAAVAFTVGGLALATSGRALVPGRVQSVAEVTYEFVADMACGSSSRSSSRCSASSSSSTCSA
jgi:F-type H+-transporting ATPase subunit a